MPDLTIQFFDVGQGDGILVQYPPTKGYKDGFTMLVDLGSTKNKALTSTDVVKFLKTHTKFKNEGEWINLLVITHGDRDHYNMIMKTLEECKINVDYFMYGGAYLGYKKNGKNILDELRKYQKNIGEMVAVKPFPRVIFSDSPNNAMVVVLAANTPASGSDDGWKTNTSSIVLMLYYGRPDSITKVMLTGDATVDTENQIAAHYIKRSKNTLEMKADVLKVAHHGSRRTSNSVKFIKRVNPTYAFISSDRSGSLDANKQTHYRLPQSLTLDLLVKHAPNLAKDCKSHSWVSAFDPQDYKDYNKNPDDIDDSGVKDTPLVIADGAVPAWQETTGTLGIFTTLAKMDMTQPEESPADQGAQYELVISDTGDITIKTTLDSPDAVPTSDEHPAKATATQDEDMPDVEGA